MKKNTQEMLSGLAAIFFISGFSALIYQVCWQRLLFTGFGVDLTSITVIVSVFMAGLGVGAYFGGRIADKFSTRLLIIFCLIELGIGCFGTKWVGDTDFCNFLTFNFPYFFNGSNFTYFNQFF